MFFGRRFSQDEQQFTVNVSLHGQMCMFRAKLVGFFFSFRGRTNCSNHFDFEGISTPKKNEISSRAHTLFFSNIHSQTCPPDV